MPDKVIYMGSLSLLLAVFSFFIVAAPRFGDNVKLAMGLLAPLVALAIDKAVFPNSFWNGSNSASMLAFVGYTIYGVITLISVNLGTRWYDRHPYHYHN